MSNDHDPNHDFRDEFDADYDLVDLDDMEDRVTVTEAEIVEAAAARDLNTPASSYTTLDGKQQEAIDACGQHRFTNISGTAGVGKTFVAKEILKQHPGVVLAATTGIASVNLGEGTTINALLKYFDTRSLKEAYLGRYLQAQLNKLRRAGTTRILIDEKSMMAGAQLTYISRAVREVNDGGIEALEDVGMGENDDDPDPLPRRNDDLPPIGITLVGDFGQLPPVPDEDPISGKKLPLEYCFDSPEWPLYAAATTRLEKIYRQDAQDFIAALHAIRAGKLQEAVAFFGPNRFSSTTDDNFEGTTIFAKNDAVERHNLLCMDRLKGPAVSYSSVRTGKQRGDWKLIPDHLRLKEGALVMLLANRRQYEDEFDSKGKLVYANGDLGHFLGNNGVGWQVRLHRTGKVVDVLPIVRENTIPLEPGRKKELKELYGIDIGSHITEKGKGKSEIIGTIMYMPVRAAYGCTVHKTQGLTLDAVQVNVRDPFFKVPGMMFVALSRARTASGLRIVGDQRGFIERCRVEPRVMPWL